jgi:hypothetical protein
MKRDRDRLDARVAGVAAAVLLSKAQTSTVNLKACEDMLYAVVSACVASAAFSSCGKSSSRETGYLVRFSRQHGVDFVEKGLLGFLIRGVRARVD